MFLTKVWGFDPSEAPVIGFSTPGARSSFLGRRTLDDDWLAVVATNGAPTPEHLRGRLLFKIRTHSRLVDTEATLKALGVEEKGECYDEDGNYLWQFGLIVTEAREFVGHPDLKELLGVRFGMDSAISAISLSDEHAAILESLETRPVEVRSVPEAVGVTALENAIRYDRDNNRGTTGPGPTSSRSEVEQNPNRPGYVYWLKMNGLSKWDQPVIKVGYSAHPVRRCRELNDGLVSSVTGYNWELSHTFLFERILHAYNAEQLLLRRLAKYKVEGEQEIVRVALQRVESAWNGVLADAEWLELTNTM